MFAWFVLTISLLYLLEIWEKERETGALGPAAGLSEPSRWLEVFVLPSCSAREACPLSRTEVHLPQSAAPLVALGQALRSVP